MVDLIKTMCAQNGTSIKALERELGFGNGTIRRWDDSRPSYEKIQKVADYFGVSVDHLLQERDLVERIRALCKHQKTSLTKLEEQLGFGNGTIGKWKNAKNGPPVDKLTLVANALGTTTDYLLTGEAEEEPAPVSEMDSLYQRIEGLCLEHHISGYKLCKDIGMSPGQLTDLKKGRQSTLSATNANKIANYFGVSVNYLLTGEEEKRLTMFRLRLKALRESKGLSQAAFAKEFGVAQGTIGNRESGTRMPSAATIAKIAEHFGVPVGYLLEEDEEKEERPAVSGAFDEEDIKVFLMYARSNPSVKAMIKAALMAADEAKEQNEAITKEARNTVVKVAEDVMEMLKGLKGWE